VTGSSKARLKSRKGVSSRVAILSAAVAILLVSALGAFEYVQLSDLQSQNRTLSSEASTYSSEVTNYDSSISELQAENQNYSAQLSAVNGSFSDLVQTWTSHVLKFETVDGDFFFKSAVLEDYLPNATMMWSGTTMGLGGTYVGTDNISLTLQTFLEADTSFNMSIDSFNVTNISNGTGDIGANLSFTGSSVTWGALAGTISANYVYLHQNGEWLISQEDWNFESFSTQYAQAG
jgi:hypothetical protein